ncbi:LptF/LptG family permease [Hellea sp.]|nr:LptF/LptG family permease [Hellea sp.]
MMFSTLNRYLIKRVIKGLLLAFLVVTSIIMLVDFVEATRNIGADENIGSGTVFLMTLLKAPKLIEQTIPFVVLFGVMGTLYSLNRRSELIVLRASGLSAWRFLSPAIIVAAILGVMWALAFNPLASSAMNAHDNMVERLTGGAASAKDGNIWLREGSDVSQTVIFAETSDILSRKLFNATFYIFEINADGTAVFERRLDAKEAELVTQGYWQLRDVIENAAGEIPQRQTAVSLPTVITVEDIRDTTGNNSLPPFWDIPETIKKTERAGFSTVGLRMQLNKLLCLPIMLVAMTIIAAGVSMNLTREGGTLRLLIIGGVLGFAVYFADNVVSAFGEAAALSVILAVWAIPLFVMFFGISYLAHIEDG